MSNTYTVYENIPVGAQYRQRIQDPWHTKEADDLTRYGEIVEVPSEPGVVKTMTDCRNNAELVRDALVPIGALDEDEPTLDMTFGLGRFWTLWEPKDLTGIDIIEERSPYGHAVDYRDTGFAETAFTRIVLDGPYRLNGTPDTDSDGDYGVHEPATWQERHESICGGIKEASRLLRPKGILIVKCQDQVCSGMKRWQTRVFADHAESVGFRLKDKLDMPSFRDQPPGRRQVHSRQNFSSALVLVKR